MALLVAAIDIGTTHSGWAFSLKGDFDRDPTKITTSIWIHEGHNFMTIKVPTCVLIKKDGKTFEAFGYEAESKYAEYVANECPEQYYFFRHFKMELFGRIGIERDLHIEDATGKKLCAITVLALSIRFLKKDLLHRIAHYDLTDNDVHWVLTVPAIWNDAAKHCMRKAAEKAGISPNNLTIALESEAASIFHKYQIYAGGQTTSSTLPSRSKYLLLDAGGWTVDLALHEITSGGSLKELYETSVGEMGCKKVDEAFEDLLDSIFGNDSIADFKQNHLEDYTDMLQEIDVKKRQFEPDRSSKFKLCIPVSLKTLVEEKTRLPINEYLSKTRYKDNVTLSCDKLVIKTSVVEQVFKKPVRNILDYVQEQLRKPILRDCSTILMVGGFSDSHMLSNAMSQKFSHMNLIIPLEADIAILKGAVLFGHDPSYITGRCCKKTYGVKTTHKKSEACNHPPGMVETGENGDLLCCNIFSCHVKEREVVKLDEKQHEKEYSPLYDDQECIVFDIYASSSPNVNFVTEKCCTNIGSLTVEIPDKSLGRKRKFGTRFMFGGTEIKVSVTDKATGKVTERFVDFFC